MKALTVRQPWANQIARGEKTIELRSWSTRHRGELLICAGKKASNEGPFGVALCIVRLIDCRPMRPEDAVPSRSPYRPGLFSWIMGLSAPIEPFAVKGQLGLYNVCTPANGKSSSKAGGKVMAVYERGDFVKTLFHDKGCEYAESMWVQVTGCDEEKRIVYGRLNNHPVYHTHLKAGSPISVAFDQIHDFIPGPEAVAADYNL